jgi:heavy metal sensor kinase
MSGWSHRSLRFRLAWWYGLGGTLLLAGFSAALYGFVARRMAQPLSEPMHRDLAEIHAALVVAEDGRVLWRGREVPPGAAWPARNPWFELWDEQDQLVRRLWPFNDNRLDRLPTAPIRGSDTLSVYRVAPDISLRVFSTPYRIAGTSRDWMIRVIRIHEPAGDALGALLGIIVIALPLVVALLVAGGFLITRRWLKPLEQMVLQAEGISIENLAQRLPVADAGDEIGRLATAFNRTLSRLEDSFQTLDRFVADASHELRTPLTTLRTVGEVGLRRGRTVEEYREIIASMLEETQRLQRLVERLLELATAEGGAQNVQGESVRLDVFVEAAVAELALLADAKQQQVTARAAPCTVRADPVLLRQALQNLIENATKYSPVGATIRVAVETSGGECRVSVVDEGPGVPEEHRPRIADRFYRVENSRTRGRGGFGLGLAITKAYMAAMGGRLECTAGVPRGACFTLVLPAAASA